MNCSVINHCWTSVVQYIISRSRCASDIYLKLTNKQWFLTQHFTAGAELFRFLHTHTHTYNKKVRCSYSFPTCPLSNEKLRKCLWLSHKRSCCCFIFVMPKTLHYLPSRKQCRWVRWRHKMSAVYVTHFRPVMCCSKSTVLFPCLHTGTCQKLRSPVIFHKSCPPLVFWNGLLNSQCYHSSFIILFSKWKLFTVNWIRPSGFCNISSPKWNTLKW